MHQNLQTDNPIDIVEGKKAILTVFSSTQPITKLIVMGVAEGRTHLEIGEALNMSAHAVKKRLATFRKKVKEVMECS